MSKHVVTLICVVVHHCLSKSCIVAAVCIISLDHCPEFDKARAVVMYPSDDAMDVSDLDPNTVDRVFIIDSKW